MPEIDREIAAFDAMREKLEKEHLGKWVVLYEEKLAGVFDTFEAAAESAVSKYGRGPYLIRQVGAPPITLPASVMYYPAHAGNKVRV